MTRKLGAVLIQITALNLVVFLLAVGSIAAVGEAVPWKEIALLHLAFYLLQVELGCICLGISAFLWRGGLGIGLGLAIALYFVNIIANLTSQAEVLKYITPFGYADGAEILSKGAIHGTRLLAGAALAACGVTAAYLQYRRKDIR